MCRNAATLRCRLLVRAVYFMAEFISNVQIMLGPHVTLGHTACLSVVLKMLTLVLKYYSESSIVRILVRKIKLM